MRHLESGQLKAGHVIGEFRASLDGIKASPAQMVWMSWSYALLEPSHREVARAQIDRLFASERYHGASLVEWLDWVGLGCEALRDRLSGAQSVRLERPDLAAAQFLSAWFWQCTLNAHERYAESGLHVSMGLGQRRAVSMEWDVRARPAGRVIHLEESSLKRGQLNTHAALAGFPGLPPHCSWPTT